MWEHGLNQLLCLEEFLLPNIDDLVELLHNDGVFLRLGQLFQTRLQSHPVPKEGLGLVLLDCVLIWFHEQNWFSIRDEKGADFVRGLQSSIWTLQECVMFSALLSNGRILLVCRSF
jgi:hypothetical protein